MTTAEKCWVHPYKAAFSDLDTALARLRYIAEHGTTTIRPRRAYKCPSCHEYHLTSKGKKTK